MTYRLLIRSSKQAKTIVLALGCVEGRLEALLEFAMTGFAFVDNFLGVSCTQKALLASLVLIVCIYCPASSFSSPSSRARPWMEGETHLCLSRWEWPRSLS